MVEIINATVPGRARFMVPELYRSNSRKDQIELGLLERKDIKAVSAGILTAKNLVHCNSGNTAGSIAVMVEGVLSEIRRNEKGTFAASIRWRSGVGGPPGIRRAEADARTGSLPPQFEPGMALLSLPYLFIVI